MCADADYKEIIVHTGLTDNHRVLMWHLVVTINLK